MKTQTWIMKAIEKSQRENRIVFGIGGNFSQHLRSGFSIVKPPESIWFVLYPDNTFFDNTIDKSLSKYAIKLGLHISN
jgi:hypothetical protein